MQHTIYRFWAFTLLLLLYRPLFGQNLDGKIVLDDFEDDGLTVMITNLNSGETTLSNHLYFSIPAQEKDTLFFESFKTEPRKILVTKNILTKENLEIHLNKYVVRLAELKALGLSGYMDEDIAKVKDTFAELKMSLKPEITDLDVMNMKRDLGIKPVTGEIPMQVDFIKIFSFIANKVKKKKKKIEKPLSPKTSDQIRTYLGDDFFTEELGLPFNEIEIFLMYVAQKRPEIFEQNYLDVIHLLSEEKLSYDNRDRSLVE